MRNKSDSCRSITILSFLSFKEERLSLIIESLCQFESKEERLSLIIESLCQFESGELQLNSCVRNQRDPLR